MTKARTKTNTKTKIKTELPRQLLEIDLGFSFLGRNICRRCHLVLLVLLHIIIIIHIIILIAIVIKVRGQVVAINVLQVTSW